MIIDDNRTLGRKCKTVSFDLKDDIELGLMEYAESKGVFSRYIKRLIQRDKNGFNDTSVELVFEGLDENQDDINYNDVIVDTDDIIDMEGFV